MYFDSNSSSSAQLVSDLQKYSATTTTTTTGRPLRRTVARSEAVPIEASCPSSTPATPSYYDYSYNIWQREEATTLLRVDSETGSVSSSSSNCSVASSCSPTFSTTGGGGEAGPFFEQSFFTTRGQHIKSSGSTAGQRKQMPLPSDQVGEYGLFLNKRCMEKSRKLQTSNKQLCCTFCKNNNEKEHIYRSHTLKDLSGRVTCPFLKLYTCPICGESGENAHTITYCKKYKYQKINSLATN